MSQIDENNCAKEETEAPILYFGALRERDIDLLILEESSCSTDFLKWILNLAGIKEMPARLIETRVSTLQTTGESDIEVWFEDSSKQVGILLLENKIGANLQPTQAKRYIDRGETYTSQGRCNYFQTTLIAPQIYLDQSSQNLGFGSQISYEQLIEWFLRNQSSILDSRTNFKISLIKRAIGKAKTGYCAIEDAAVTDFWKNYWVKALQIVPELQLRKPEAKPARSLWARFKIPVFSSSVLLLHKLNQGNLDLQFRGQANRYLEFKEVVSNLPNNDLQIEITGGSIVIRKKVPIVDPGLSFLEQEEAIGIALVEAKKLLDWFLKYNINLQKILIRHSPLIPKE